MKIEERHKREVFKRFANPNHSAATFLENARNVAVLATALSDCIELASDIHNLNYQEMWDGLMKDLNDAMAGTPETDLVGLERATIKRWKLLIKAKSTPVK